MIFVKVKSLSLYHDEATQKEFIELCKSHTEKSRSDDGCLAFFMRYNYLPKGVKVTFIEMWEDEAALKAHGESANTRPEIGRINELRDYKELYKEEF